ncbi:hypothetical protein FPQ18DRAFT_310608 [Pyronema domesticum]|nr:hypothetical protein FPQ18DRAFT_310608 [Pyronema domesticum]
MHSKNVFLSTVLLLLSSIPILFALPGDSISDPIFVGLSSETAIGEVFSSKAATVSLRLCHNKNWGACQWFKLEDNYCWRLPVDWTESITGYDVRGGCCVFWSRSYCTEGYMFEATNRQHSKLGSYIES